MTLAAPVTIGSFAFDGGTLSLADGLTVNGGFTWTAGTLRGTTGGAFIGNVTSPATGVPGTTVLTGGDNSTSAGTLEIYGEINLHKSTKLLFKVGTGGLWDFLDLHGNLSVEFSNSDKCTLAVQTVGGAQPAFGDVFPVAVASSINGDFAGITSGMRVPTEDGSGSFLVNYGVDSDFPDMQNFIVLSGYHVTDSAGPVLTTPPSPLAIEATGTTTVVDFSALVSAVDAIDGPRPVSLTLHGTATSAVGYAFPFGDTVADASTSDIVGNTSTATFTVRVADTTPPVIDLPVGGFTPLTITVGAALPDYAAQAIVSDNVVVTSIAQDPLPGTIRTTPGTVTVKVKAVDSANHAATLSFTVNVADLTPPTLTAVAVTSSPFVRPGRAVQLTFTANEPIQAPTVTIAGKGAIVASAGGNTWTAAVLIASNDAEGIVPFSIAYRDLADNAGTTVTATTNGSSATVDKTPPVITDPGAQTVEATGPNGAFVTFPFTATDNFDALPAITVIPGFGTFPIDTTPAPVSVTATDDAGNVASLTVNVVVSDTTAPTITVTGTNPISIPPGSSYTDEGATATDLVDGTRPVSTSGHVDTTTPGTYTLTYAATDTRGNRATATRTVTVLAAGGVDPSFAPAIGGSFDSSPTEVLATAVQPDGKTIIGGNFTSVNGTPRRGIARLNADGSLDAGFDPNADDNVFSVAVQTDGKIILGGTFSSLRPNGAATGTSRNGLARINADGSLDTAFDPAGITGAGALALQPDGKILLRCVFTPTGGTAFVTVVRLKTDGSLDPSFTPPALGLGTVGSTLDVLSLAVQPDGKILLGGRFGLVGTTVRTSIARLNKTGSLDTSFTPPSGLAGTISPAVFSVALQPDGKVLLAGRFTTLGTTTRKCIARLNANGSLDSAFDPNAGSNLTPSISSMALQADGKILFGGSLLRVGSSSRNGIARVHADGTLDVSFAPYFGGADRDLNGVALQAGGGILACGTYNINTSAIDFFDRLANDAAPQSLAVLDATQVLWRRAGTAPEVAAVTFEFSTNGGTTWTLLASPTHVADGWQLSTAALPKGVNAILRARGRVVGGYGNGSSGLVETTTSFRVTAATATTGVVSNVTSTGATVAGTVNAHGSEVAAVSVEVGFDATYGQIFAATPATVTGTTAKAVSANLTGLEPGTIYHFRVKATTPLGSAYGDDVTFATLPAGGLLSFVQAAQTANSTDRFGNPNILAVAIQRTGGDVGAATVEVSAGQPTTLPSGFSSYVYGTDYRFAGESAPGKVLVGFADGRTTATVTILLLAPATTKNGVLNLNLGTVTGEALLGGGATVTTVTVIRDTAAPVLAATVPGTVGASFNVTGTVLENIALSSFSVKFNGVAQVLAVNPRVGFLSNKKVPFSANGLAAENGVNTILIEATDTSGNRTAVTKTTTYTNNRPALAGTYSAVLTASGPATLDNTGYLTVKVTAGGSFTGTVFLSGTSLPISGLLGNAGVARFGAASVTSLALIDRTDFDSFLGALAFSINASTGLSGTLSTQASGGSVLASMAAKLPSPPASSLLNQPASRPTKGVYTLVFPAKPQTPALTPNLYPQGDGYATLTISATGTVVIAGRLADDSAFTAGIPLAAGDQLHSQGGVPVFIPLYDRQGYLSGALTFATTAPNTDVGGTDLVWLRPALSRARYYRAGWPSGIKVDAVGAKYLSLDFGQGAANATTGNASLVFTDGLLSAPVSKAVSIDPTSGARLLVPAVNPGYTFTLTAATGLFSGTFDHDNLTDTFRGILINKGENKGGFGYFLSTPAETVIGNGESGGVSLQREVP